MVKRIDCDGTSKFKSKGGLGGRKIWGEDTAVGVLRTAFRTIPSPMTQSSKPGHQSAKRRLPSSHKKRCLRQLRPDVYKLAQRPLYCIGSRANRCAVVFRGLQAFATRCRHGCAPFDLLRLLLLLLLQDKYHIVLIASESAMHSGVLLSLKVERVRQVNTCRGLCERLIVGGRVITTREPGGTILAGKFVFFTGDRRGVA